MELGLKAIGFPVVQKREEREQFVKSTRHNLLNILSFVEQKNPSMRAKEEMEWIRCYFADLSQKDRESDSFRYPFHMETVVLMQHDTNKLG